VTVPLPMLKTKFVTSAWKNTVYVALWLNSAESLEPGGPPGVQFPEGGAGQSSEATRVPSLQLCTENFGLSGTCGFDYSCVYSDTISWSSPSTPLLMTVNPRAVFENLFREPGAARDRSILDIVAADAARFQTSLGAADRGRLHSYLEDIRGIERRIQAIEKHNASAVERELPAAPLGVPDSWEEHIKLMFDLQALALAAEITRLLYRAWQTAER
jgi:hypothetical protein